MKFHENRSKGSGDNGEDTKFKVILLTLTYELDLESRLLGHVLCTPSN